MKQYVSFFRIRFLAGLQYRAAAWAGISTQFAWGAMTILMFRAFYRSGVESFPMDFEDLSCYIWLQQAFLALFMTWFFDNDIFESISTGTVAYEFCRPCDLYTMWFVKNMATRVAKAALRFLPVLLVAALLPAPYGMRLPASLGAAVLFPVSMALGFLVLVAVSMLIYISAFYTLSSMGIRLLASSVIEFLAGGILPLPFFPQWLQRIMYLLPFGSIQNTPFLIYTGYMGIGESLQRMGLQLIWLAVLVALGRLLMKLACKRVIVQGG